MWNDDIIYNTPDIAIHCRTEWEAKELFEHLDALGVTWEDDERVIFGSTYFDEYGSDTCYNIDKRWILQYGPLDYYQNPSDFYGEEDNTIEYNIVEFNELFCNEATDVEPTELLDFIRGFQNGNNSAL